MTVKAQSPVRSGRRRQAPSPARGTPDSFGRLFEGSFIEPLAVLEGYATSGHGIVYPWDLIAIGLYNAWIRDGRFPFIEGWGVFSAQSAVSRGIVDVVRRRALNSP